MATPLFPWYSRLERTVAPTEAAANLSLAILIAISLVILWKGSPLLKAGWVVYLVSP